MCHHRAKSADPHLDAVANISEVGYLRRGDVPSVSGIFKRENHPRNITMAGIRVSGAWNACVEWSQAKAMGHVVPKHTQKRADNPTGTFFVRHHRIFPQNVPRWKSFAIICVGDYSRFKMATFLKHNNKAAAA